MARRHTCFQPRDRFIDHGLLRVVRSMLSDPYDDTARNEFVALAYFFVRIHDDAGVYWCLADVSMLRFLGLASHERAIGHSNRISCPLRLGCAAILAHVLDWIASEAGSKPAAPVQLQRLHQRMPTSKHRPANHRTQARKDAMNRNRLLATVFIFAIVYSASIASADEKVVFEDYFHDKALRLELYQCGNAKECDTVLQNLVEEPCWPENPKSLVTPFAYGKLMIKVMDASTNRLIYAKGFDTLFAEYATTQPALTGGKRVFQTTTRIPLPKAKVKINIERRNGDNSLSTILTEQLDPADIRIRRESTTKLCKPFDVQVSGLAHDCLDIVFVSEGYTAMEQDKFKNDVQRMSDYLLSVAPYKSSKDRISIRGVFRASEESGTDSPRRGVFRNTELNSSFNTLDIDRYLLLDENHRMHQMAACVPYDTAVVLVNSSTYGGGAICLDYCVCTTDASASLMVFVHELGHSLAYLADEYVGNVSYNDIYPEGVEPVEPNITRQLDPSQIKWKAFLSKDVALPTQATAEARSAKTVGAFEGGGYLAKGMYRPQAGCWMGSANPREGFCLVCEDAIQRTIDFYSPPKN